MPHAPSRCTAAIVILTGFALIGGAPALGAQGPSRVGMVHLVHDRAIRVHHSAPSRAVMSQRRITSGGRGALIGMVAGAALGLLAIGNPGQNGGDGVGYELVIGGAVIGAGVGALIGYIAKSR